jgi:antitoxin (DNA-binding transcriptional repressor) of toxin-antitoxin stability system
MDAIILTRDGRPFATIQATPEEKNRQLLGVFGKWRKTDLDNDRLWKRARKRINKASLAKQTI